MTVQSYEDNKEDFTKFIWGMYGHNFPIDILFNAVTKRVGQINEMYFTAVRIIRNHQNTCPNIIREVALDMSLWEKHLVNDIYIRTQSKWAP